MKTLSGSSPSASAPTDCLGPLRAGLELLYQASRYARESQRDCWEYAVEIQNLLQVGMTVNDLRRLLCWGYALHAVETTTGRAQARTFRPLANLSFTERTSFVLTPQGEARLRRLQAGTAESTAEGEGRCVVGMSRADLPAVPRWDDARRELRWGTRLVKRYRQPAPNQEYILASFEEENWPAHLDDPLPTDGKHEAKQRLHDTIKRLNRNQVHSLVRFSGDGTGTGVFWQPAGQRPEDL